MAFSNDYILSVDLKHRNVINTPTFAQGENAKLRFRIYDNNVKYNLNGFTRAEIVHKLPSGQSLSGNAILNSQGEIEYSYPTKLELAETGVVQVILTIYSNNTSISIKPFNIYVFDNLKGGGSLSYVGVLQDLITNTQDLKVEVTQVLNEVNSSLENIKNISFSISTEESIRELAESTRTSNENARKSNETVRSNAESIRVSNENTRTSNESSRVAEESTRNTNELSRKSEESKRASNETTRISSENNRVSTESLRTTAETNRKNEESKRVTEEGKRVTNETTRVANENARKTEESKRVADENIRISNESSRVTTESKRVSDENTRNTNENERKIEEGNRVTSENLRKSAETTRDSSETSRVNNESLRVTDENLRKSNESTRITKENERITNESSRVSNESSRVTSENDRKSNETTRINAETQRNNNENTRKSAETLRQQAYSDAKAIIDNSVSVGVFNLSTPYKKNNRVLNNGSTWMAKVDTANNPLPTLPSYENTWWILEAQRGIDGTGSVKSVNGFSPDVNGNVLIADIGSLPSLKTVNKSSLVNAINELYDLKADKINYGVKIDATNSNPETAVTYIDKSTGFTPAKGNNGNFSYGSWEDKFPFNQIKPCLIKDGKVNYYLNPNDYTKKADGSTADITSGNDGDVMVEFPKVYWKFETIGTDLYIRYSDERIDSQYKCLAHTRGNTERDFIYLSAYMGYETSGKLRSLSGKTPTVSKTIGQFRTLTQSNGSGYEQSTYYQILMLQVLFIIMFKNRDSQSALGRGYVDGNTSSIATGGTNQKGLFYGESTGKLQNKFCGVEDFWGNTFYWVDGLYSDASRNILIGNDNYNDTGSGYTNYGQGATSNIDGYIDKVQGGTETGFIIKSGSGSATTHYGDYGGIEPMNMPRYGGAWTNTSNAGFAQLIIVYKSVFSSNTLSSRLSYY